MTAATQKVVSGVVAFFATVAQVFAGPYAYLVSGAPPGEQRLMKIDIATGQVVRSGLLPGAINAEGGIAISPAGHLVYVTDTRGGNGGLVFVLDTDSLAVRATITVGQAPEGIAIDRSGEHVYVANLESASVSVIETDTYTVEATIPLPTAQAGGCGDRAFTPFGIAVNHQGTRLAVGDRNGCRVALVDTKSLRVISTLFVGRVPGALAFDGAGSRLFVATHDDGLIVIDVESGQVTAAISDASGDFLALTPSGRELLISSGQGVHFVDTTALRLEETIRQFVDPVGGDVTLDGGAIDALGKYAYVCTANNDFVRFDMRSRTARFLFTLTDAPQCYGLATPFLAPF